MPEERTRKMSVFEIPNVEQLLQERGRSSPKHVLDDSRPRHHSISREKNHEKKSSGAADQLRDGIGFASHVFVPVLC